MLLSWLPWLFWGVAIVASSLYGAFAIQIFVGSKTFPRPWVWHQRWFNFFGSMVGWLAAWLIILRHCGWPITTCVGPTDGWDLVGALIAFLGMTGHLPFTIMGLAEGVRLLAAKAVDYLK